MKFSNRMGRLLRNVIGLITLAVMFSNPCVSIVPQDSETHSILDTTVCELVQRSSKFNKKVVRVHASVVTDGIEHTLILDDSCPKVGVSFSTDSSFRQRANYQELRNAILDQAASNSKIKKVTATLTGRFIRYREGRRTKVALEVENISDIEIVR